MNLRNFVGFVLDKTLLARSAPYWDLDTYMQDKLENYYFMNAS